MWHVDISPWHPLYSKNTIIWPLPSLIFNRNTDTVMLSSLDRASSDLEKVQSQTRSEAGVLQNKLPVEEDPIATRHASSGISWRATLQRLAGRYGVEQRGIEKVSDHERTDTTMTKVGTIVRTWTGWLHLDPGAQAAPQEVSRACPGPGRHSVKFQELKLISIPVVVSKHGRIFVRSRGACHSCFRPRIPWRGPGNHLLQSSWCSFCFLLFLIWTKIWSSPDGAFALLLWLPRQQDGRRLQRTRLHRLVRCKPRGWLSTLSCYQSECSWLGWNNCSRRVHPHHRFIRVSHRTYLRTLVVDPKLYDFSRRPWSLCLISRLWSRHPRQDG